MFRSVEGQFQMMKIIALQLQSSENSEFLVVVQLLRMHKLTVFTDHVHRLPSIYERVWDRAPILIEYVFRAEKRNEHA